MEEMITLNKEKQILNDVIIKLIGKEINIKQACKLIRLSERQIYRKQKAYIEDGIKSISHKLKFRPSKKCYNQNFKDRIVDLYNQ